MAFELLSEPIRKFVRRKGWESLRKIQAAAIQAMMSTDNHYILASATASGKTEAAFLPILSKTNFNEEGVQVLYISPLIALINDQFNRVEELCEDLEISVTKWHGEARKSEKNKLLRHPNGVVLITPESLEAMFVNAPYNASSLFSNLRYIVIDELHAFLGTDRGVQLRSIISRLQQLRNSRVVQIGLSATIGRENFMLAKRFVGKEEETKVLLDSTKRALEVTFDYFPSPTPELNLELLKNIYKRTAEHKVLIFPNSRGRTEEIAVKLLKIANRVNGHQNYFAHHSSVDKEIREHVERFAKTNQRFNFCIACTSTLELGIDIGSVDKVVQVDSTHSIASLIQRVGRSGRREGDVSQLHLYATDPWSLLQSLASWNLYQKGFIEPLPSIEKPYDLLLHQMLSIVKQYSGISSNQLINRIIQNPTFETIQEVEIKAIIDELLRIDFLELIGGELIIGVEGEYIVNSREFYSVFTTNTDFKVQHNSTKIGAIPYSLQLQVGENMLLAASIWKITDVDLEGKMIAVVPAKDGKKPKFSGGAGDIHHRVREEMFRIITNNDTYPDLNASCLKVIKDLRFDFSGFMIEDHRTARPVAQENNGKFNCFTFTSTRINRSIAFLLKNLGYEPRFDESSSSFILATDHFDALLSKLRLSINQVDHLIEAELAEGQSMISFAKWAQYLPLKYQIEVLKERYFDFQGLEDFLEGMEFVTDT